MFSSRFPSLMSSRWSLAVDAARAHSALLDLTVSNPTEVGLALPAEAILGALADPRLLRYSPEAQGLAEARQAIADHYNRDAGSAPVDPARLFLCASTSEAYGYLFKLLCNPGERVLAPRPSYPLFEHLARFEGVHLDSYPLRYHAGWFLELDELARRITPQTRALLVVHPNNPTGSYVKADEWEALIRLCQSHRMALISDEVFAEYALAGDGGRVRSARAVSRDEGALTFTLGGLSKLAGLPQLKLGWLHVSGPSRLVADALPRLELLGDTYLSASAPVQYGAARLLALGLDGPIRARVVGNHQLLRERLRSTPVQLYETEGGWSAVLRLPRITENDEEAWVLRLLAEERLLVQPGWLYDFEEQPIVVVSLLVEPSLFAEGIARLVALVTRQLA